VAYVAMPRCATFPAGTGGLVLAGLDPVTAGASHELIEAATDPFADLDPAFATVDADHIAWAVALGGGEVGDLCAGDSASFVKFPELPYVVQRSWSNAAAAAGHDPCVPTVTKDPYFAAAPVPVDTVAGPGVSTTGVLVAPGTPRTIDLDLFSDGPLAGPMTVQAREVRPGMSNLSFQLDRAAGENGDTLHLTISASHVVQGRAIAIEATVGAVHHSWYALVDSPAPATVSLGGTLTDGQGPLAGVAVCLVGTQKCAQSDVAGNYSIAGLPSSSNVMVTLEKDGYLPLALELAVKVNDVVLSRGLLRLADATALAQAAGAVLDPAKPGLFITVTGRRTGASVVAAMPAPGGVGPVYENDQGAPDPMRATTGTSGGILYLDVAPGDYDLTLTDPPVTCSAGTAWPSLKGATLQARAIAGHYTVVLPTCK
jgi:hypothetical protein